MMESEVPGRTVDAVRAFNRFYTREVGLLDEDHLGSGLSLSGVRALYELAQGDSMTPSSLSRALGLDAGYVSRLLRMLEARTLIARSPAPDDARSARIRLTAGGRRVIARLQGRTHDRLVALLAPLSSRQRAQLVASMAAVRRCLDRGADAVATVAFRDPRPGDIGLVVSRQAALYAEEYGWDWTYEALVAGICARFIEHFDPARERCWIAERDGALAGSVFVVRKSATVAQLRMLYVEPDARGLGIGRRLVDECIAFARRSGYRRMILWTNDVLVSARRIYEAAGFALVDEEPHRSFGRDLVGQTWATALR